MFKKNSRHPASPLAAAFVALLFGLTATVSGIDVSSDDLPYLSFRSITVGQGLANKTVHSVVQDHLGFVWMGTRTGLSRYDGVGFKNYFHNPDDPNSLSDNLVNVLFSDSQNRLWVGTQQGLCLYDEANDVFRKFHENPELPISSKAINKIVEDDDGGIWVGSSNSGVTLIERDGTARLVGIGKRGDPVVASANELHWESGVGLWVGGYREGLYLLSPEGTITRPLEQYPEVAEMTKTGRILSIHMDTEGSLWVGVEWAGVVRIDLKTGAYEIFEHLEQADSPAIFRPTRIIEDRNSNIWISSATGLLVYLREEKEFRGIRRGGQVRDSLITNYLSSLYLDRNDNLWICSYHFGVSFLGSSTRTLGFVANDSAKLSPGEDDFISSTYIAPSGRMWVGAMSGGLREVDRATKRVRKVYLEDGFGGDEGLLVPLAAAEDHAGNLWFSCRQRGLFRLDRDSDVVSQVFEKDEKGGVSDLPLGDNILAMYFEDSHTLVFSTLVGIYSYNTESKAFHAYRKFKRTGKANIISRLLKDSKGRLWAGNFFGDVLCYRDGPGAFEYYKIQETQEGRGRSPHRVVAIREDAQGRIWVASHGEGLSVFNEAENRFDRIDFMGEGVRVLLSGLVLDKKGYLWMTSERGVVRYDPEAGKMMVYQTLGEMGVSRIRQIAESIDEEGVVYFGSGEGVVYFDSNVAEIDTNEPIVYFTDLLVNHGEARRNGERASISKNIILTDQVNLYPGDDTVTLKFAALSYDDPSQNSYRYILEGFDREWRSLGARNEVTYTNLDPGDYTFRLMASNNKGIWTSGEKRMALVVNPALYQTMAFQILCGVAVLLIIALVFVWRNRHLRAQRRTLQITVEKQTRQLRGQNLELAEHRNNLEKLVEVRTADLEKAKDKAERSDRLKSAFLANTSHEIRTPLNAIVNLSKIIAMEDDIDPEEREAFSDIVQSNCDSLLKLIDDILDVSKIESGNFEINREKVDLVKMLGLLELQYKQESSNEKDLELKLALPDELELVINTDRARLSQALVNLIDNALKFTESGQIVFGAYKSGDRIQMYVEDTGIGISEEDQKTIFGRFNKIDPQSKKLYRGVGLGLAISSKIVELLGGELSVQSERGKGSRFFFSLPLSDGDSPKTESSDSIEVRGGKLDLDGCTILIVEDEPANREVLRALLKDTGFAIVEANTGEEAIQRFREKNPDIVLMDLNLPGIDGYTAAERILEIKADACIVGQSAFAMADYRERAKRVGFSGFVPKPISREELLAVIHKAIPLFHSRAE